MYPLVLGKYHELLVGGTSLSRFTPVSIFLFAALITVSMLI